MGGHGRGRHLLIASFAVVAFGAAGAFPAAAQHPPEGGVADPSDPSVATVTFMVDPASLPNPGGILDTKAIAENNRIIERYHYDCTLKQWVLDSVRTEANVPLAKDGFNNLTINAPGVLPSGPPPGATTSSIDPDRAHNSATGQNYVRDGANWIDVKTGETIVAPKLCPETATTTPPPPPATPPTPQVGLGPTNPNGSGAPKTCGEIRDAQQAYALGCTSSSVLPVTDQNGSGPPKTGTDVADAPPYGCGGTFYDAAGNSMRIPAFPGATGSSDADVQRWKNSVANFYTGAYTDPNGQAQLNGGSAAMCTDWLTNPVRVNRVNDVLNAIQQLQNESRTFMPGPQPQPNNPPRNPGNPPRTTPNTPPPNQPNIQNNNQQGNRR